ncbi:hypothetical protein [Nostoc sp.]|uniref:hypothetical protein n=1 Tax=Nostoc sp. TaxID=1180 RepID=UPI002FF7C441
MRQSPTVGGYAIALLATVRSLPERAGTRSLLKCVTFPLRICQMQRRWNSGFCADYARLLTLC